MNKDLQTILNLIQQSEHLTDEEKNALLKSAKSVDKELEVASFKLDRTEKVKRTTAILLEETIEELENKRKAVEAQNKELEIESSLERVRTVAMSMNKPDDMLHVCQVISEQLELLKVKEIRNVQTAIFYKEKGIYMNYEYYAKHDKTFITETTYTGHEIHEAFADKMLKGNGEFYITHIKGDEVKDWIAYQKTTNVFIDDYLYTASSLNYYWFSLGPVALGISTYVPLTDEETNLFKRFLKVFELSYRRYLDIEKAEAQAYEAKVEASLEKVRAVAMSMNKPDDLLNICETLFKEFSAFGFADLRNAMINIHNDEKKTFVNYDYSNEIGKSTNHLTYDIHPVIEKQIAQVRSSNDAFSETVFAGEDLDDWKKFRKEIGEKDDPRIKKATALYYYFYSIGTGSIGISTFSPVSAENLQLLKRFRNVFNLSYQRYTDLALAEAQAREAQIELALERVRARTMAMQKSAELAETSFVLFQQFKDLGETSEQISIGIFNEDEHVMELYSTLYGSQWKDSVKVDLDEPVVMKKIHKAWKEQKKSLVIDLSGKRLREYNAYRKKLSNLEYREDRWVIHVAFFSKGAFTFSTTDTHPETIQLLERFAGVFDGTYTRFLDLQKSEAQARESQIQLALERVRARTMAMQRSEELGETAVLLFKQIADLGAKSWSSGFQIWQSDDHFSTAWMTNPDGSMGTPFTLPYTGDPFFKRIYEARKSGKDFFVMESSGEELKETYRYMFSLPEVKEVMGNIESLGFQMPTFQITHCAFFLHGFLMIITYEPVPEFWDIFKRFAKVFEQTYTRFLDLQKAEAQARESQIQLALERVRARTMAMHESSELIQTAELLFDQLKQLGAELQGVAFAICDRNSVMVQKWTSIGVFSIPYNIESGEQRMYEAWKNQTGIYEEVYEGERQKKYYELFMEIPAFKQGIQKFIDAGHPIPTWQKNHAVTFQHGYLLLITTKPFDETQIFLRFGKVFEQTYTRFLDLQKAEAQARESQIQLALERVRARSLAMRGSNELANVVTIVNEQLQHLGLLMEMRSAAILILEEGKKDYTQWIASPLYDKAFSLETPYLDNRIQNDIWEARQNKTDYYSKEYSVQEKNELFRFFFKQPSFSILSEEEKKAILESTHYELALAFEKNSSVGIAGLTGNLLSNEEGEIVKRIAKVFEQAYIRFLDLQKAEAQAREAQIEAALERVRSRSMGMQKSEELRDVIQVIYEQMVGLNINVDGAGFAIDFRESDDWNIWHADAYTPFPTKIHIPYFDHPVANAIIEAKNSGVELLPLKLTIEERNTLLDHVFKYAPASPEAKEVVYNTPGFAESDVLLKNVILYIQNYAGIPYTDAENAILIRFGKVFEQTYTRFNDLKKAEAQALEAIKRASVDRVRAEIASMRTTNDLERITPLIWNELTTLGVPFIRCGVFIMDEEKQQVQTMLSTPDGKAIATLLVPFDFDLSMTTNGVAYWKRKEIYKEHWDRAAFIQSWSKLASLSGTSVDASHADDSPENLYLHLLPFLQGMLYVGNETPLNDDALQLVQNLADAFSTAYARYEDFNKLEAAKKQVDSTLNELQATQKQLIQSEKMASLGELTAGIAHEIQNPLNFVNNFSEVNKELIEELQEERNKTQGTRDEKLENEILNDIKENEEKISHHGKRADSIVKGMLQHSRSSAGVKELTDINALADEYLRLSYHGLRAKDNSFNATLKTDFDTATGKINTMPQDIGRLLLNLYNNAFYALNEKKKSAGAGYEPTVSVSTKKSGNQVSISVSDNGIGISKKAVDKIFQPFFTTKPTGQGTGLGLSLAYDIVKAHGGEIKVETKEGEGSEFVIMLPVV